MKLEVYKITNKINGKIYVGITIQGVSIRWCKHVSDANGNSPFPLHNAIRKYGKDNFIVEIIETLENEDFDQLKEREKFWIKELDSYNRKVGYNLTLGGDGTFGRFHSEETKDKIRQKAIGRKVSEKTKQKMSESQKKREYNHEELSERTKKWNTIKWSDPEYRLKVIKNSSKSKLILQFDLDGNLIQEFISVGEAARSLNKHHGNIAACARGQLKQAYNYIWKYK